MQLLFIIIVFSCKAAASLLIYRLTCHKTHRIYALAVVTASAACCLISLMLVSVELGGSVPWIHQQDEAETVVSLYSMDHFSMPTLTQPATDPQMDCLRRSHQHYRWMYSSARHSSGLQP